ncbi:MULTISPECIES: GNAT family N-acetyltransferase [Thiomicrorhabdus]|uniref:GNAT family N-acetyltransferase n=1 Tax=Thiomicrorhabdus heinhorstiae TaxID=2748010 RepID=A0ABS0BX56_9GAMM|nr:MULTISPECIES: GNAT family N-acetyltransferase [Thiomicrorhabdus]MBF6057984.1 GNAT family N-acetyltransferase [Thiomicrorhabdus heinhorstiae]
MTILIQPAQPQDISPMVELLRILFAIEVDFNFDPVKHRTAFEHIVADENCGALLALSEDKVIGMCTAQWVYSTATGQKSAWIEDVIVHPDFQGKGVGHLLMEAITQWCRNNGCNRMQLAYDLQNQAAIHFYLKQEFTKTQLGIFSKPI